VENNVRVEFGDLVVHECPDFVQVSYLINVLKTSGPSLSKCVVWEPPSGNTWEWHPPSVHWLRVPTTSEFAPLKSHLKLFNFH
jgi:hypothetical protein